MPTNWLKQLKNRLIKRLFFFILRNFLTQRFKRFLNQFSLRVLLKAYHFCFKCRAFRSFLNFFSRKKNHFFDFFFTLPRKKNKTFFVKRFKAFFFKLR